MLSCPEGNATTIVTFVYYARSYFYLFINYLFALFVLLLFSTSVEIHAMRLPRDPECDNCDRSLYSTDSDINHDMPNQHTFVPQLLPTVEELDDNQQDIDYLSLATGHAAGNHSVTTN